MVIFTVLLNLKLEIISNPHNKINYNNYYLQVTDEMLDTASDRFKGLTPQSKEAYYYRQIFEELFPKHDHLTPYYWMPKWSNATDPSARVLKHYK